MKKAIHLYRVYVSDSKAIGISTKWKQYNLAATRRQAWRLANDANQSGYRFVKIIEERLYKGKD